MSTTKSRLAADVCLHRLTTDRQGSCHEMLVLGDDGVWRCRAGHEWTRKAVRSG